MPSARRISALAILFTPIAFTLGACTTDDWGRCLMSHEESRPTEPIVQPDGTVRPSGEFETVTICDRWEYPNGVRPN